LAPRLPAATGREGRCVALNGSPTAVVRAAGGIVWRPSPQHGRLFLLVHRPAYDDWTFPKGKVDVAETEEEAALREVAEETGLQCRLQRPVGTTSYVDRRGRPKVVYYWLMRIVDGAFAPNREVDEIRWVPLDEALDLLTYERDRVLIASLAGDDDAAA
jgi:8-oxo-dGTP pyrophosphatase MutT (NUDIX family)